MGERDLKRILSFPRRRRNGRLGRKRTGPEQRLGEQIFNYADDQVICCKGDSAVKALKTMMQMIDKLKLTVNEEKTRTWHLPEEPDSRDAHVRFDERDVKMEHGLADEAPANERAGNRQGSPKPPRHIPTLPFS